MKPLYIWAGGKNKMIPKYTADPSIPYEGYDVFVEPFFGGGAMMCHIAANAPNVKRFVLNDINPEIVGIYTAIKTDVDSFIQQCDALCARYLPLTKAKRKEFYYSVRKDYMRNDPTWTPTQEAATLYFMMKTCFNGIFQANKESKGRFATPCGLLNHKDSVYDVANVREWHEFLQRVDIHCGDWQNCVDQIEGPAFYFMDPPYRDSFTQYGQVFGDDKHVELIEFCKQRDAAGDLVMYCNRDAGDNFYTVNQGALDIKYYDVTYTAGRRATEEDGTKTAKAATEVLLHSASIQPPVDIFDQLCYSEE